MKVVFSFQQIVLKMIVALIIYLGLDSIYLRIGKGYVYPESFVKDADLRYGAIAWLALAFGLSAAQCTSAKDAFLYGSLIGFVAYAVFNGTETSINKEYRSNRWYLDILYGTLTSGLIGLILFYIFSS